jgi:signal transduction histidine kinase
MGFVSDGGTDKKRHISIKSKKAAIICIIVIIAASYGSFFYLQNSTERDIKSTLFADQKQRQLESTKAISQHINSDLNLVLANLKILGNYGYIQNGNLSNISVRNLMQDIFLQISPIADRLYIMNQNGTIIAEKVQTGEQTHIGRNISKIAWISKSKTDRIPTFSNGYVGLDGVYRIGVTYPIINRDTGQYIGLVGAAIPSIKFFSHYGNLYDVDFGFLAVYDNKRNYIATPRTYFIGKNFFGSQVQNFFHQNNIQNNLYHTVFSGQPGDAIYNFGNGERLNTGYPIFLNDKPTYFLFIVTPTSVIYSHINDVLYTQRIETFFLLVGITVAVAALIIFLIKWNSSLYDEVMKRTSDLNKANKQLDLNAKSQKDFINIAAHELRTPTQAIVGFAELAKSDNEYLEIDKRRGGFIDIIYRNSIRLHTLIKDILDITRIESNTLILAKDQFNISEIIRNCMKDISSQSDSIDSNTIKILFNEPADPLYVEADRVRVYQVISNLLTNAIKFTKKGTIIIMAEIKEIATGGRQIVVSVKDTGPGIDLEIVPRLFTKFTSKSDSGTGLGLYISKSIVEAHGGKIWAENNADGIGATFTFTLPLRDNPQNVT